MKILYNMISVGLLLVLLPGPSSAQPTELRIDPAAAVGAKAVQVFKQINYIPLETKPGSVFGKIDQMRVTREYFIILDHTTNAILVFKKNGDFHARILGKTTREEPREAISTMTVDPVRNEVLFTKATGKYLHRYNFDAKRVGALPIATPMYDFHSFGDGQLAKALSYQAKPEVDSNAYKLHVTQGNAVQRHFPYKPADGKWLYYAREQSMFLPGNLDTTVLFSWMFDYHVYELTPGTLKMAYRFVLPMAASLPGDFLTSASYPARKFDWLIQHPEKVFSIGYVLRRQHLLFFRLQDFNDADNSFLYNLRTGGLVCLQKISPDASNWYMPVAYDGEGRPEFSQTNFLDMDADYLYTAYSADAMFRFKDANAEREIEYPGMLYGLFNFGSRKNNPVIVQLKLQPGL
ncbi:6-bladed beta-propeller [Chitinophaga horti]|uniref:6-bladed beta-propeller n=1 Tax=Chitinophaga horti TaxID=2920382 RepID=A0ABY6J6G9_9BACT|nr:6-bladed beta-propeller [Chitinophaga horti]UYQ95268.1 6-bladed beta-propeller [Chitinophaga horti]